MFFSEIAGLPHIKNHLTTTAQNGRIPHAQLFVGNSGSGTLPMAIAYAQYLLCKNSGGENENGNNSCNIKFKNLSHPDLHFVYPVATNSRIKSHPVSTNFIEEWRNFIQQNPYGNSAEWYKHIGIENKQAQIGVDEAHDVVKNLSLKAYEGGLKVMIIWMADRMNIAAANKLLKLIEEPPTKTIFILITEDEGQIIQTIKSRCQILNFPPLPEVDIAEKLKQDKQVGEQQANLVAHQANGSYTRALTLLEKNTTDDQFEQWFIDWVRTAFKAKGNKATVLKLVSWSEEIANLGREQQKSFLLYCLDFFRQALVLNYKAKDLVYLSPKTKGFQLSKFAQYVHGNNIIPISKALEDAIYHIERNGNAKIILTDLSIRLTRFLHIKTA
ncbi:ATP-binding protein [Zunongwangia sp.]|uniref:DNA polymerase III subunit n=1 Tax=Zunongwangia sp. TaxID=1965325 RepID=UPI003AA8D15F